MLPKDSVTWSHGFPGIANVSVKNVEETAEEARIHPESLLLPKFVLCVIGRRRKCPIRAAADQGSGDT